jgi:hypothetical protein
MSSLENLGRTGRFNRVSGIATISLIILGFLGTTASVFWTFTTWANPTPIAVEQKIPPASPALVCECTIQIPSGAREERAAPVQLRTASF